MNDQHPASYLLSEPESAAIFSNQIAPTVLSGGQPQDQPHAILLCAQAGAGKSVLARDIRATFPSETRPVIVDVDLFRPFYPGYLELHKRYGQLADDLVQADSRRWLDKALNYLTSNRINIIAEHGLRDRHTYNSVLDQFHKPERPYRVSAALLATPAAQSRLGILERYQVSWERTGFGRYVTEAQHDERYNHTITVADWLTADKRIEQVAIYQRGSTKPVHQTPDTSGQTLNRARNQPWSLTRSREFVRHLHSLEARMEPQWTGPLNRARHAANNLVHSDSETPNHNRPAITFGRYQIVSIAHLDTIRTILLDWPTVEIGILDLDHKPDERRVIPPELAEFYADCETNTASTKNPMTVKERATFWRATIQSQGLETRVSVSIIPRPELQPDLFNQKYPPDDFDLVFPRPSGEGFDQARNKSFEQVLARQIYTVEPPLEYHTSNIRTMYRNNDPAWRHGLAPGGLEAFLAADGPRRLLAQDTDTTQTEQNRRTLRRRQTKDRRSPEIEL